MEKQKLLDLIEECAQSEDSVHAVLLFKLLEIKAIYEENEVK